MTEPNPFCKFVVGDVVRLKGETRNMTVIWIPTTHLSEQTVSVTWMKFDDTISGARFPEKCLTKVDFNLPRSKNLCTKYFYPVAISSRS